VIFEHQFTVKAPVQSVWQALLDVRRVAPCMPGAEVLDQTGADAYRVGVKVRLGPISLLYRGQVEIVERDEAARHATLRARAQEARGQGTANATVQMRLEEAAGGETLARLQTELALSGRAAAMGRGVIGEVAEQLIGEFARNLQAMLAPEEHGAQPPAPAAGEPASGPAAPTSEPPAPAPAAPAPAAPASSPTPPPPTPGPQTEPTGSLSATRLAAGVIASRLGGECSRICVGMSERDRHVYENQDPKQDQDREHDRVGLRGVRGSGAAAECAFRRR